MSASTLPSSFSTSLVYRAVFEASLEESVVKRWEVLSTTALASELKSAVASSRSEASA